MSSFQLTAWGVHGGDTDCNRSAFFLKGAKDDQGVVLDGGSIHDGMLKWAKKNKKLSASSSPTEISKWVHQFHRKIQGYCITHSHLDHVSGLALRSLFELEDLLDEKIDYEVKPIHCLSATAKSLKEDIFNDRVWVPLWKAPLKIYEFVTKSGWHEILDFRFKKIELTHTVPTCAFLFENKKSKDVFCFFGDTGPTDKIWRELKPLHEKKKLKAIAIECSHESRHQKIADITKHMTPSYLISDLKKLVGLKEDDSIGTLAKKLKGLKIFVYHIKPHDYDRVEKEINSYQKKGIPFKILKQGQTLKF